MSFLAKYTQHVRFLSILNFYFFLMCKLYVRVCVFDVIWCISFRFYGMILFQIILFYNLDVSYVTVCVFLSFLAHTFAGKRREEHQEVSHVNKIHTHSNSILRQIHILILYLHNTYIFITFSVQQCRIVRLWCSYVQYYLLQ